MGASSPFHDLRLTVRDLDVMRGGAVVASGVGFTLEPGDALTLRGENGTGKTSILRAVAGFSEPAFGSIAFSDSDGPLDAAAVRANGLHWLGGEDGLSDRLTVTETLRFWAGLHGAQAKPALMTALGLDGRGDIPVGRLSTGQRRRVALARLISAPRALWLLDEPLSGLDTAARELLFEAIAAHRAAGGLVLMATHDDGVPSVPTLRLRPMVAA